MVSLSGALGSGKTVFVKGIASGLNLDEDELSSPTYTIIQEYGTTPPLYHIDLYRISGVMELGYLGFEEILQGKGICLIEWGEKASAILPEDTIYVNIQILPDGKRLITVRGITL